MIFDGAKIGDRFICRNGDEVEYVNGSDIAAWRYVRSSRRGIYKVLFNGRASMSVEMSCDVVSKRESI